MNTTPVRTRLIARSRPFDGIRHALRAMLTSGLLFALLGAALTETIAIAWTRTLPTLPIHLTALAIALLAGYAAVVTVALRETLHGIVSSLELITREIEKLTSRTLHDAETLIYRTDADASQHAQTIPPARRAIASTPSTMLVDGMLGGIEETPPVREERQAAPTSTAVPAGM